MIESKIDKLNKEYYLEYPVLKIFNHKESGNVVVVLFREEKEGTCLYNKINPECIGRHSDYAEDVFTIFNGEIILKNKGDL